MTKISQNWKGKDLEQFIILRKLAGGSHLRRMDFESPRQKVRQKKFNEDLQENREHVPHSSLIKRLEELLESNSIEEIKTKEKSKKGLPIKSYQITFFGFLKLLSLSHDKGFLPDVMENIKEYLPFLAHEFHFLSSLSTKQHLSKQQLFTKQQLFDTITTVCKNTTIAIDFNAKNRTNPPPNFPMGGVPSTVLLKEIKWAHQYYIEVKVRQMESTYHLKRLITIKGVKKDMRKESEKVLVTISGIINSAFFYELLMRCRRHDKEFSEYIHRPEIIEIIIERLRGNAVLRPSYVEFLCHIELKHNEEAKIMKEFMLSLSTKESDKYTDMIEEDVRDIHAKSLRF